MSECTPITDFPRVNIPPKIDEDDVPDFAALTNEAMRKQARAVDQVCLASLHTDHGVLVTSRLDFETNSWTSEVSVSAEVPYGEIHYRTEEVR